MLEKLRWAWRIVRSSAYLVLTDKSAVISLPVKNADSFNNTVLLAAQASALREFRDRLEDLIDQHDEAIALAAHRQKHSSKSSKKRRS